MQEYKVVLGVVAAALGFLGFLPYIRDIYRGTTKPHVLSWFLWGFLEIIAFAAQLKRGGGAGAWATGVSAVMVIFIALLALRSKDKGITAFDWIAFGGSILAIISWQLTHDPFLAIVLVTVSDALAF